MRPDDFLMLYYDDRDAFREIVRIGAEAMMAETRHALALAISMSINAPIPDHQFGVFRM